MFPREIFLSHSNRDRRFAAELVEVLRRHGIRVWYSEVHIKAAQQWHDEIGKALKRCDWFAIVLSPNAVRSMWVKNELLFALNQRHYRNRIAPILHKKCNYENLSWTLPTFQICDFTQSHDDGYRDLLRIWGAAYRPTRQS
jgi:TIR domain-containing protein